jgi:CRP-like cAMP-binding protein
MYFISSGKVEVDVLGQKISLTQGNFFGEMSLVTGQRRQGDVYTRSYCQLLALKQSDFKSIQRSDKEL